MKIQVRSVPLSEKLPLYFVIVGLSSILIVGFFSYYSAQKALLSRTYDQLTSVRVEKQRRIEKHLSDCNTGLSYIGEKIGQYLSENTKPEIENNPTILSMFDKTSQVSQLFTEFYLMVDAKIYRSDNIESDLSLCQIEKSSLIDSIRSIFRNTDSDIQFFDGTELVLVGTFRTKNKSLVRLAGVLDQSYLNNIMLERNVHNGLGASGEVYLVGEDMLMRSSSRFINQSVRSVLVETSGVIEAFNGETGYQSFLDYRGIKVLSSFGSIRYKGIHWAILAELDESEAMTSIVRLKSKIMLSSILISFVLLVFSFVISRRLTRPLIQLSVSARSFAEGNFHENLPVESSDEIGQLTESFNYMMNEIQMKNEALKKEKRKQLKAMIDGQELERQRFSRELHDGLGQYLSGIKMKLEQEFKNKDNHSLREDILHDFNLTIEEVRRMSNDLRPSVLENFGISSALRQLIDDLSKNSSISFYPSIDDIEVPLSKRAQTYLFRMAQEGLNNSLKHAHAKNIALHLYTEDGTIVLIVEDDGIGYQPENVRIGNGLLNMKERTDLLKGTIEVNSQINRGTIITIKIPYTC